MTKADVARWVREARTYKGWTQEQLADEVGVTKANISHWETGKHDPSFLQLLRIRDLTGYALREVAEPETWPFRRVRRERWDRCGDEDRGYVQAAINRALDECEAMRTGSPGKPLQPVA